MYLEYVTYLDTLQRVLLDLFPLRLYAYHLVGNYLHLTTSSSDTQSSNSHLYTYLFWLPFAPLITSTAVKIMAAAVHTRYSLIISRASAITAP